MEQDRAGGPSGQHVDVAARRRLVGEQLRLIRLAAKLSGEQVAAALGWTQVRVSRIETGRHAHAVKDVIELLSAACREVDTSAGGWPRR